MCFYLDIPLQWYFFLATSLFYIHMSFQQEAISDTHPRSSLNSISFVYIINPLLAFVDTESSLFLCPAKSQPQLNLMLKNEQKYHPVNNRTFLWQTGTYQSAFKRISLKHQTLETEYFLL